MATIDVAMESTSQEILSKVSSGVVPDFRSPINVMNSTASSFTGTGKGILTIIQPNGSRYTVITVTVDGVTICTDYNLEYMQSFSCEFRESFTVTQTTTYGNMTAVFY